MSQLLPFRRSLLLVCTLLAAIVLSVAGFAFVGKHERERLHAEFAHQAHGHASAIQDRVNQYQEALSFIVGLYAASHEVDRQEFREFVAPTLARLPGIQALIWVPRVPDRQRRAYEAAARTEGLRGFQISERDAHGRMTRAVRRGVHFPIHYVEPTEGNETALGLDMASDPVSLRALETARDAGRAAATGPITLQEGNGATTALLVAVPMYRKGRPRGTPEQRRHNLNGFAVGLFRIGDMVEATLKGLPPAGIDVYLYDRSPINGEQPLYVHASRLRQGPPPTIEEDGRTAPAGLSWRTTFDVAGRRWSLSLRPAPEFLAAHRTWQAWGVLAGGLLFSGLLGAYLLNASGHAARVERLVRERTTQLTRTNEDLAKQIAERERAEGALRESEARFRAVAQSANDAIIAADSRGNIIFWNTGAQGLFGYTEDEIVGTSLVTLMPERYRDSHQRGLDRFRTTGEGRVIGRTVELHGLNKDGREFPVEVSLGTWETAGGAFFTGILRDISDRKRAEEALKESEERYRDLVEHSEDLICTHHPDGTILSVNQAMVRHLGCTRAEELLGHKLSEFLAPDVRHLFDEYLATIATQGHARGLMKVLTRHGEERILEYQNSLRTEGVQTPIVRGRAHDVTDRRRMDQTRQALYQASLDLQAPLALHERLDRLLYAAQKLLELDRVNILLPDRDARWLEVVASTESDVVGRSTRVPIGPEGGALALAYREQRPIVWDGHDRVPEEWRLHPPYDQIEAFRSRVFANMPLVVRGTAIGVLGADRKHTRRPLDPITLELLQLFVAQAAVSIENARLYEEVTAYAKELEERIEDRTRALRETQVQLVQSGKLAAVGTLAAGVAHELNQPLMVIRGYAQELLEDERIADTEVLEDLRRIEAQTTRMAAIVSHLRDFSRQSKGTLQPIDLNAVLTQVLDFVRQQLKSRNIEVVQALAPDLPTVRADPLHIEQVFLNLITNAGDAIESSGKGTILVRTEATADGRVSASITDTGPGIPPDIQDRIFDPFFTTKEVGKGTGLGLSICHGIVQEHRGALSLESPVADGRGARFTVALPADLHDAGRGDRG
jgi:PAS domain S-box-containing protein